LAIILFVNTNQVVVFIFLKLLKKKVLLRGFGNLLLEF